MTPRGAGARRPGEFLYWEHAGSRWARAFRAGCKAVLGFDPAPPDDVVETIGSLYYDADPLAEAFVEEVYLGQSPGQGLGQSPGQGLGQSPGQGPAAGRAMLDQAIAGGAASVPDAPASLLALFADIDADPPWVDRALVDHGAKVFRRYGSAMFRFAGAVTLEAYSESSVAKPLILTGAYAGGGTRHRFLETVAFWIAVSEPGGLAPGAPGLGSALRVRIMHVFVRKRLLAHPEWDTGAWGVPISQGDALLTLMGGSFAPGVAMQAMGYRPSVADIEAMMHFWRYVGHLMGVRPRWYPASMKEAFQLAYVTIVKGAHRAGDDGVHLCQSYADAFAPETPAGAPLRQRLSDAWHHGIHRGYTRFFLPPWTYRKNRLPPAGLWALHPLVQFPFIFAAETLRRAIPRLDEVADRMARRSRQRWFARHMGDRDAEYRPATSFTR